MRLEPSIGVTRQDPPLAWHPLTGDDLILDGRTGVAALAARCLAADGGLPLITSATFLSGRFAAPGGVGWGATDRVGTLVAAGAVRPQETSGVPRAVFTGLVDPAHRGRGVGSALLDWGLAMAGGLAGRVAVETEALTDEAVELFTGRGLRLARAEDVLRIDLTVQPAAGAGAAGGRTPGQGVAVPASVGLLTWSQVPAGRFFEAYQAAFRDRPGFPGWSKQRWVDWTADDDEFRPQWSLLATDERHGDVGFITCADGWIVQVGVRPDQRGRGLGAALVTEALRRMRAENATEALLDVDVDNPAGRLYRRLGFVAVGRRARFEPAAA